MKHNSDLNSLRLLCADLSTDRFLVQGAGGNASYKDSNHMYIKSSGKKMADALTEEIFVKLPLRDLKKQVEKNTFSEVVKLCPGERGRASIETHLHVIFPQRYVIHLHMVESVKILIQRNWREIISNQLGDQYTWIGLNYYKPGITLAEKLNENINVKDVDILFLQNHGIVAGSDNIDDLKRIIYDLQRKLSLSQIKKTSLDTPKDHSALAIKDYKKILDGKYLTLESELFRNIQNSWAICPDHVVFLGDKPVIFNEINDLDFGNLQKTKPPFIFIKDLGVYQHCDASLNQCEQFQFYLDVMHGIKSNADLNLLSDIDISSLLNWDAEKYRVNL